MKEISTGDLEVIKGNVSGLWEEIVSKPDCLTDLSEQKVIFAAGGALVTKLGDKESLIWQKMVEVAGSDGKIAVAGVPFLLSELERMGDFYRYLKEQGYSFHCIDERLEGDAQHLEDEVHEKCGACAAVGEVTGLKNVEDILLKEIGKKAKQEIYSDMPDHVSMVILVDFFGADVALGVLRGKLKEKKALPFNASLPLELVRQWGKGKGEDESLLVPTLVKWNVQIARNIIGGDHNELRGLAKETIIVADIRKVENNPLLAEAEKFVRQVEHGRYEKIGD